MNTLRTALLFVFFLAMLYAHGQQDTVYQYRIEPLIKNNTRDRSPNKVYDYTGEIAGNYVTAKNSNGTSKKKVSFTGKFEVEVADLDWVYLLPDYIVLSIGKTKAFRDYQLMGREQLRDSMINYEFMKKTKEPSFKNYFVNYYNKHGILLKTYNYPAIGSYNEWSISENGEFFLGLSIKNGSQLTKYSPAGELTLQMEFTDSTYVRSICASPNGRFLACSLWKHSENKNNFYVLDENFEKVFIENFDEYSPTFSFSSDSRYLIVRSRANENEQIRKITVYDTKTWNIKYENSEILRINMDYTNVINDNFFMYMLHEDNTHVFYLIEMNTNKILMKQQVANIKVFRSRKMLPDKLKYMPETQVIELQLEDITHKFQLLKK